MRLTNWSPTRSKRSLASPVKGCPWSSTILGSVTRMVPSKLQGLPALPLV